MTHLFTLSLFGGFHVTRNGRPVTNFRTDKVRALLAYLAIEAERPHRRETLAAILWPEQPQTTSLMNLRQSLYRLRRAIGDKKATQPLLRITRAALQWNSNNNNHGWVDVITFHTLLEEVKQHSHQDICSCASCLTHYQQAVSLYHGPLLAGFSLSDSEPFESWLRMRQDFFHQQVLQALYDLTHAYEEKEELELAQQYAQQQLTLEPWREVAYQQLMRVLAKNGQRAAALAQYEECSEVMAEELGVKPSLKTTLLYEQIRDGLFPRATDMAHLASRHTLPMPLTAFIGRQKELKQLDDDLKSNRYRVLTLLGQGGIGKSRLALHFATTQFDYFTHGVYLVSLLKVNSADLLVSTMATALSFSFNREDDAKQQLLDYLREREMLLVIDNAEHLDCGVSFLLELLSHAPKIKLLVTTRRELELPNQVLLSLKGFPLPDENATPLSNPAMQLFQQRAREIGHIVLEYDFPCIRRICRLVGGMPLAIELVASWVRLFSCQEIAQDMLPHSDFLRRTSAQTEIPTLQPVFNQAWARLSPSEKYVLRKLSVFTGDFDSRAAEQVAGASPMILQSLSDKLFFRDSELTTQENQRYEMHDMIRQYTADKLDEVPQEVHDTRNRHGDYYAHFLKERTKALTGQEKALQEINVEIKNIRAAWQWAITKRRVNTIGNALQGLFSFYDVRSWFQEGVDAFKVAGQQLATPPQNEYTRLVYTQLLSREAWFTFHLGHQLEAKALLKESLARAQAIGHENETLFALNHLAIVYYHLGEYESAQEISEKCLQMAERTHNQYYIARACNTRGQVAYQFNHHGEAERYYQQSLEMAIQVGDRSTEAFALAYLGQIAYLLANLGDAKKLFERSLQIREKIKDARGVASCYISLGDIASTERNYLEAQELYAKSQEIFEHIGNQLGIMNVLIKQGQLLVTQSIEKQAAIYFQKALDLALKSGTIPQLLLIFNELVNLLSEANELEWANQLLMFTESNPNRIELCEPVANRLIKWLSDTVPRLSVFSNEY